MTKVHQVLPLTALVARTPCPGCGTRSLEFLMRCDLGYGPCLYTARCRSCGRRYEIGFADSVFPASDEESPAFCPECGEACDQLRLACDSISRSCRLLPECAACGVARQPA